MYASLDDEYVHTLWVPGFVKKWFGPGRIFQSTTASDETEKALGALAVFLKTEEGKTLGDTLKRSSQLRDVFSGELTFDAFVKKLEAGEYNKDLKFRKKVNDVVAYISQYMPQPGENAPYKSNWPAGLGYASEQNDYTGYYRVTKITGALKDLHKYFDSNNQSSWINKETEEDRFKFSGTKKEDLVKLFKKNYKPLLDTLVTGEKKIREEFQKHDQGTGSLISTKLTEALKDTDYDNKESKDYIVPKQTEERNFVDRIKKFKDDTYDNYIKQFLEPRYGAHVYHTTYARTVGEAFDKVGIKPSGGIDGILAKKDDIIKEINKKAAGKALKHFNWFCTTMEEIKKSIPKAYNDALRNPHQMRAVVTQVILKALKTKPYDDGEAKTAMELLALTRYGVMASRFREGLSEGLKGATLFSDDKLSWNKNEGIKFVTGAVDTSLKFGLKALALGGTVGYNLVKNRFKRKFGKDISGNEDLAAAYKTWKENDKKAFNAEVENANDNKILYEKGYTKSGVEITDGQNSNIKPYEAWVFYKKLDGCFDTVPPANYENVKKDYEKVQTELDKKDEKDYTDDDRKKLDELKAIDKYDKLLGDKYIKQYLKDNNLWDGKEKLTPVLLQTAFNSVEHNNGFNGIKTKITEYNTALNEQKQADSATKSILSQIEELKQNRLQQIKNALEKSNTAQEDLENQNVNDIEDQIKLYTEQQEQLLNKKYNPTYKYSAKDDASLADIRKKLSELNETKSSSAEYQAKVTKLENHKTLLEDENTDFTTLLNCFEDDDKTKLQVLQTQLTTQQEDLNLRKTAVTNLENATPNIKGFAANATDLEDDVTKYRKLMIYSAGTDDEKRKQWRKDNADDFAKLIAFWDELDSFTKTHSFKFGNMKLRRDLWLKNFNRDKDAGIISPMEEEANEFAQSYYDNINYER